MNTITYKLGDRGLYLESWRKMYDLNPKMYKDEIYKGVTPQKNQKLVTEIANLSVVAFDSETSNPVGLIASVVLKNGNVKEKSFLVNRDYQHKGIGSNLSKILYIESLKKANELGFKDVTFASDYTIRSYNMNRKMFGDEFIAYRVDEKYGNYYVRFNLNKIVSMIVPPQVKMI